jgi:hypothetical protein
MSEDSTYYPLILNGGDLVPNTYGNSTYRYTFPSGSVRFKNSKCAIANINLYYSWFNITAANDNTQFQISWPVPAGYTTYTVNITTGFYSINDLNEYLQQFCINNGLYLINASGQYVYYLELVANPVYYSIQLNTYPVPTALPAGWTAPALWPGYPLLTLTPRLIVPNTNFTKIIGFNAGTYPAASAVNYSKLSDFTPQITPVQSVIVSCSLVNNKMSVPSSVLYSFGFTNVSFGSVITVEPTQFSFIDIQDGNYPYFDVQFLDQDFNALQINDTNLIIQLLIKTNAGNISF